MSIIRDGREHNISFFGKPLSTSNAPAASQTVVSLEGILQAILQKRAGFEDSRSVLVAISGIDASGKGYVSERLARALESRKVKTAVLNVDFWLESLDKRYNQQHPADHFYAHGIRFAEMFASLIHPLRETGAVTLTAPLYSQTGEPFTHLYHFRHIDVVIVEGIFLLKRELRHEYDLAFWIECSFDTALRRAVNRNQEKLPPEHIIRDFQTVYFPAQQLHLQRDDPRSSADAIFLNDTTTGR